MNKFAFWASSVLLFGTFICNLNFPASAASRHKKTRSTRSVVTENSRAGRRSKHSLSSHSSAHKGKTGKHLAARPRYAYPMSLFLMEPPTFEATPLPFEISNQIKKAFYTGNASEYPTRSLVRAGIASYYPMRGGVFWRREPIKYLVMHSTEPGIPVGAKTIVDGWSHGGRRHAGAHYVIDRDGTIYQSVDPDLATVHVNIFKTLPGINNDNSIGVEMCHNGGQDYPPALVESAIRLAAYLQSHYHIPDANIITHRYAQQGDHTDPVNFAWDNFLAQKDALQNQGLSQKLALLKTQMLNWQPIIEQPAIIVVDRKGHTPIIKQLTPKTVEPKIVEIQAKPEFKQEVKAEAKIAKPEIIQEAKLEIKPEQKVQSAFEAKFGPVDKPVYDSALDSKFGEIDKAETPTIIKTTEVKTVDVKATSSNQSKIESVSNAPAQTQTKTAVSAPVPSYSAYSGAPISMPLSGSNNNHMPSPDNRLIPTPPVTRLVPVTMVINTQPNINASRPTSKYLPASNVNEDLSDSQQKPVDSAKKSNHGLPLRGPIEMEPDEATLLSQ